MTQEEIADACRDRIRDAVDEITELWWMRDIEPCSDSKRDVLRSILDRHVLGEGLPDGMRLG